jgi:hypothetical protein
VNSCRKMMPDPEVFGGFIQETFDELYAHAETLATEQA